MFVLKIKIRNFGISENLRSFYFSLLQKKGNGILKQLV